jgi:endo-1,4-beta-xylanase
MRRRSFLTMGGAAGMALAMPGIASAAVTAPGRARAGTGRAHFGRPTLRGLAAPIGLHMGTAVIPFDLDTPAYAAILAAQFSAVTPGNEMKWGVVEPSQVYAMGLPG